MVCVSKGESVCRNVSFKLNKKLSPSGSKLKNHTQEASNAMACKLMARLNFGLFQCPTIVKLIRNFFPRFRGQNFYQRREIGLSKVNIPAL